jgi:hypothetical protein
MTSIKTRLAHLTARRLAAAASLLTISGLGAGGAVFAVAHASGPTSAAPAASAATATPSSGAGANSGHRPALALALVRAAAKETGIAPKTIRQDLLSGQTLDQIAGGKAAAVENDVLTALQTRLDKAVNAGKITKDQEANRLAQAKARIETVMSKPLGTQHTTG